MYIYICQICSLIFIVEVFIKSNPYKRTLMCKDLTSQSFDYFVEKILIKHVLMHLR